MVCVLVLTMPICSGASCLPRVIEAPLYLKHFSSDRMHMYNAETDSWNAPPPTYPCIQTDGVKSNLKQYIDMTNCTADEKLGVVLTLDQLRQRFS
jgi:hypothetical protein